MKITIILPAPIRLKCPRGGLKNPDRMERCMCCGASLEIKDYVK